MFWRRVIVSLPRNFKKKENIMKIPSSNLILIEEKKYENNNDLIEHRIFDRNGKVIVHKTYEQIQSEKYEYIDKSIYDKEGKEIGNILFCNGQLCYETLYDEFGKIVEEKFYKDEKIDGIFNCKYDNDNNLTELKSIDFDKNREINTSIRFYYDEEQRRKKEEFYTEGVLVGVNYHEYDEVGEMHTIKECDNTGRIGRKFATVYRNKLEIEEKCWAGNGHLIYTTTFTYNNKNYLLEKNTYKKGELIHQICRYYNKNNKKVLVQQFIHKKYKHKWQGNFRCKLFFSFELWTSI